MYRNSLIFFMLVLIFSGCAQKVTIKALEPAEVNRAAVTKKISVAPFKNDTIGFSRKLEGKLANQFLDGRPYFTVISKSDFARLVDEQKRQYSGLMDEEQAVELGNLLGAQAMISGSVTSKTMQDTRFYETRTECVDKKCEEKREYKVSCTKRTIGLGVQIKMVDVERGDIIYGDTLRNQASWEHCRDDKRTLPSKEQGLESLSDGLIGSFVYKLTPHYVYFRVSLLEEPDLEYTDRQEMLLENALAFIDHNRLDRGEALLQELFEGTGRHSYVAAYNLGVVKEAQGQYEDARYFYQVADELAMAPVEEINYSINRIEASIRKQKQALEQIKK